MKRPALIPARWATPIGREFGDVRALNRDADHVGLELHKLVVARRAAVDEQSLDRSAARAHRVQNVGDLMGDGIERRAGEGHPRHAKRKAANGSDRGRIPPRRAEAAERRHDINAARVWRGRRKASELLGVDAEQFRRPHERRSGGPDIALERQHRRVDLPRERQANAGPAGVAILDGFAVDEAHD